MYKYKFLTLLFIPLFSFVFLFAFQKPAHANILDDIVNTVKDFLTPDKKEFKIDSNIALAPGGDVDKDGQIDAGDIVRFSYIITNTTDQAYSSALIKTNINRQNLNFIHNVTGTANLGDDGKTITIPNFNIGVNQPITITFDARVNYDSNQDSVIATEAEFLDKDKHSIAKSLKKEIKAKLINKEKIPGMIKQQIKKEDN